LKESGRREKRERGKDDSGEVELARKKESAGKTSFKKKKNNGERMHIHRPLKSIKRGSKGGRIFQLGGDRLS